MTDTTGCASRSSFHVNAGSSSSLHYSSPEVFVLLTGTQTHGMNALHMRPFCRWGESLHDTMASLERRFSLRGTDDDMIWIDIFAVSGLLGSAYAMQ
jgi:hypothetical protein